MRSRCVRGSARVAAAAALAVSFALAAVPSARSQTGYDAAAHEIARQIRSAWTAVSGSTPTPTPCRSNEPIELFFHQGDPFTEVLLRASRAGQTPISVSLPSATTEGQLPAPVAEALNRLQAARGRVQLVEERNDQSLGAALAWGGTAVGAAVTAAVHLIVGAALDQWASSGLARYNATVVFRRGPGGERLVHAVVFECAR